MIFNQCEIEDVYLIELEPHDDERGFFARAWCQREFEEHGLTASIAQCNLSYNAKKGTLRGMHYQAPPHGEAKVVRCIRGSLYMVAVDLRPDSRTYLRWVNAELSAANRSMLYIPVGCAAGYLTLEDETETFYLVSEFYVPHAERGARWNDPAFAIEWPDIEIEVMSEKDKAWPDYEPAGDREGAKT